MCLQIVMLNSLSDLHGYVDKGQLTQELGGSLEYCHSQWIHHRTVRQHTILLIVYFDNTDLGSTPRGIIDL